MKYINFNKITIQNFLSVGNDPVCVDFQTGIHIITGINKDKQDRRNGVGKSTIADAIHFAIFGTTLRELKKDNIVNNITGKGCQVELDFTVTKNDVTREYKVIRMLEPSRCKLFVNGEDKTRDSIVNTTEHICKLLNTTQDVFQNCVIMTVNNTIPFMAKKKVEKRKFIEGIFNLEVFSKMLTVLRSQHGDVKREYEGVVNRYEEVDSSTSKLIEQQKAMAVRKNDRVKKLEKRKKSNLEKIQEIESSTENCDEIQLNALKADIQEHEHNIEKCEQKLEIIGKDKATQEAKREFAGNKLSQIGTDKDTCPVCLKPISTHDRQSIQDEKDALNTDIKSIDDKIKELVGDTTIYSGLKTTLKSKLNASTTEYNNCIIKRREAASNKEKIEQFHKWNEEVDKELNEITSEKDSFTTLIEDNNNRLKDLQTEIDVYKHKLEILDAVRFIVSEEGVKSYIVRKILQLFNHKLSYYLNKMDANCLCIFNEYFEEEIVDEKGKMCSYFNFSGAERKNIDLACLFAFMDIRRLQGSVSYNFSVYDELLDSSLDERGVDLVLGILRERVDKYNESIMIISHRKESINIGTHYKNQGGVIYLEKENGITRRVDFSESSV